MYEGNNKTAIQSQNMILDALNELLEQKKYKNISISEICGKSGISRQTFYKLFGSKENLMIFKLKNSPLADQKEVDDKENLTLFESCRRFARFVAVNFDYIKMLIESDLLGVLYELLYTSYTSCDCAFTDITKIEQEYASQYIAAGLCQFTHLYVIEHQTPDQNELADTSYKIMSGNVFRN